MPSFRRSLASLSALSAFEAAARLGGFTAAAQELGVTQAAVSRQIRALETDLRAPLFRRVHRRVELTAAGRVLALAVGQAFERIADAIDVIRPTRTPQPQEALRVGASLAFSHFWLLPRLATFRAAHPSITLRLVSQDLPADMREGAVDVAIRYGRGPFRDGEIAVSMGDEIVPVASPALCARVADLSPDAGVIALPRIDVVAHDPTWVTWRGWFLRAGFGRIADTGILQFNHHTDAIYAAMDGQGVALGWTRLLERPLRDGRLVRLGSRSIIPEEGYNLVLAPGSTAQPAVAAFTSWMTDELARSDAGGS